MKTWRDMRNEEMRRLVAASEGLLNLTKAGAPAEPVMLAHDKVCDAIVHLTAMQKQEEKEDAEKAKAEAKAAAEAEAAKAKAETQPAG
jgi:hypothetical protein